MTAVHTWEPLLSEYSGQWHLFTLRDDGHLYNKRGELAFVGPFPTLMAADIYLSENGHLGVAVKPFKRSTKKPRGSSAKPRLNVAKVF